VAILSRGGTKVSAVRSTQISPLQTKPLSITVDALLERNALAPIAGRFGDRLDEGGNA